MSRKRSDSFTRVNSAAGRSRSRGSRAPSGLPAPEPALFCGRELGTDRGIRQHQQPFPGPREPRFGRELSLERSPEAAAARLPGLGPAPPPRSPPGRLGLPSRPGLPAAATAYLSARAGRGPLLRWGWGSAGKTSLGPSALHSLRLEARRGRNKRAPLPAGAGHCATSSGRDRRPAGRRASLARSALYTLPSGLRVAASV